MQPHQWRVVTEKQELDAKRSKLGTFIESATFNTLPLPEQDRLSRQAVLMTQYSDVLAERIAAFPADEPQPEDAPAPPVHPGPPFDPTGSPNPPTDPPQPA